MQRRVGQKSISIYARGLAADTFLTSKFLYLATEGNRRAFFRQNIALSINTCKTTYYNNLHSRCLLLVMPKVANEKMKSSK